MNKVQQVCDGRAEPFDVKRVDAMDRIDDCLRRIATIAGMQQMGECALIGGMLVNVGNAQLRFPEKSMIRSSENLPLLRNGADHHFKRRSAIGTTKRTRLDVTNDLPDAASD